MFKIFEQLESTSGKLAKRDLLKTLTKDQRQLFNLALDPAAIFFQTVNEDSVYMAANERGHHVGFDDTKVIVEFKKLTMPLMSRQVTGDEAARAVAEFFNLCTPTQAKWLSRVLNKDLRVGVDSSYLGVWPGEYQVFECQLCNTYEGDTDVTGWYYEDKWNGLRALAVPSIQTGIHGWYSRNGKAVPGMNHLSEALATAKWPIWEGEDKFVCDSEGFGSQLDSLTSQVAATASAIMGNRNHDQITANVFDIIPLSQWNRIGQKGFKTIPLSERKLLLDEFFTINPQFTHIKKVRHGVIGGDVTAITARDEAISRKLEGIVMKNPRGHYKPGKGNLWLKFKNRYPVDCEIINAENIPKHPDQLGSISVKNPDTGVVSKIGTGFSLPQKLEYWAAHQKGELVGRTAEIEYGEITDDGLYFHGSFVKLRFDK